MSDPRRSARLLRAAVGLDGPVEPTAADWAAWVALASTERVLPQLYEVASAGVTDLTAEQRSEALAVQLDVAATMVRLEHSLLEVAEIFTDDGLPYAVLKGTATAHLDYGDPSQRQFGDIDLLVDPEDLDRARALLESAGWGQAYRLPRHHERFTHAITFTGSSLTELDLHQRVAHRALGQLVPTSHLLADRVPLEIAGRSLWALCLADRLIHASLHAVASRGGYRRLSSTADVLLLAASTSPHARGVLDRADAWRVRSVLEEAIRSAHSAAQLPIPDSWVQAMASAPSGSDRLVDLAYLSDRRRPVIEELAYLRHLDGWRDRANYLFGYFMMDRDLSGTGGRLTLPERTRYLWSRVRQRSG